MQCDCECENSFMEERIKIAKPRYECRSQKDSKLCNSIVTLNSGTDRAKQKIAR